jgi:hypothetical protein
MSAPGDDGDRTAAIDPRGRVVEPEDTQVNPAKHPPNDPALARLLVEACQRRGLKAEGARLIHHYSNAIYLLPNESAIARIGEAIAAGVPADVVHKTVQWLIQDRDFPATAPLDRAEPVRFRQTTVSFWTYYPQPEGWSQPTPSNLGRLLHQLHAIDTAPTRLKRWTPLDSLQAAAGAPAARTVLEDDERLWLLSQISQIRHDLAELKWPLGHGIIHGDAWVGNLLRDAAKSPDATVLADWDGVSYGPREVDLIPTWHAAHRYGKGEAWSRAFIESYGYDLSAWRGFAQLMRMRDFVQLTGPLRRAADHREFMPVLRQRLDALRSNNVSMTWRAL